MSESTTDAATLGSRVASERTKLGWSPAYLAGASGVTEKTIWRWERNKTTPYLEDAALVAAALGVSLDYLAGVDNEAVA
jgi:transcriptional regulator with XRE-family HTH domain